MSAPAASPQLCVGSYRAEQLPNVVVITAIGVHNTSGYKVFFLQSPLDIYPPEFSLLHVFPAGLVLQVVTPFSVSTSFKTTKEKIDKIVIHDGAGRHEVVVDHAPDALEKHASAVYQKDGPFP